MEWPLDRDPYDTTKGPWTGDKPEVWKKDPERCVRRAVVALEAGMRESLARVVAHRRSHGGRMQGRPIQANVGVELKGVRSGVERRRGRVLKPEAWRRDAPGKVLKDRRAHRERGRVGTSV